MNVDHDDQLEDVLLEQPCDACAGTGILRGRDGFCPCILCNGSGYYATKLGQKILALVEHNFNAMVLKAER